MYKMFTSLQELNNGALTAVKAMPQKDSTSDGTSTFELSRATYVHTQTSALPPANKKWQGNRDASQVTTNRRNTSVGIGSLNAGNRLFSFTTYKEINTVDDALRRVRAGGAVAPAKKAANPNNAPTPGFAPAGPKKIMYGIKTPVLFH